MNPSQLYVWLVPSEELLEQPGHWRIRKWDTEPFPEANYALSSRNGDAIGPDSPAVAAPSDKHGGETPRTNAEAAWQHKFNGVIPHLVSVDFARQLERELADMTDDYFRLLREKQDGLAARSATARSLDTQRMDWLQGMTVEVRLPLAHGSQHLFYATPDQGDGEETPSDIRKQIDEQVGLVASASTRNEKA